MYFRHRFRPSAIDELLDRVQENPDLNSPNAPTLEQFLDDDDFIQECRVENRTLIHYLSRRDIVVKLVDYALWNPPLALSFSTADLPETDKLQLRRTMSASEVIAAEQLPVIDSIFQQEQLVSQIFSFLQTTENDQIPLHPLAVENFAKILSSLLSVRHTLTLRAMQKHESFLKSLVGKVRFAALAEFLVRVLQSSERSIHGVDTFGLGPPDNSSLAVLVENDLLGLLAAQFEPLSKLHLSSKSKEEREILERNREETMDNAIGTLLGITMRMLQLPLMRCKVPDKLNVYATAPRVIGRMLDTGIQDAEDTEEPWIKPIVSLSLALRCCSLLMATESNQSSIDFEAIPMDDMSNREDSAEFTEVDQEGGESMTLSQTISEMEPVLEAEAEESARSAQHFPSKRKVLDSKLLEQTLLERFPKLLILLNAHRESNSDALLVGEVEVLETANGDKHTRIGSTRLCIVELFSACLRTGSDETVEALEEMGIPVLLLELMLDYEWNSILQFSISSSLYEAFQLDGSDPGSARSLSLNFRRIVWLRAGLIGKVIEAWERNSKREESGSSARCGYMGHLIKLADLLGVWCEVVDRDELLQLMEASELDTFKKLYKEQVIDARKRELTPLIISPVPVMPSMSSGEEEAFDPYNMAEVIEGLTGGNQAAVNQFANMLLTTAGSDFEGFGDLSHFGSVDDDDDEEIVDTSRFQYGFSPSAEYSTGGSSFGNYGTQDADHTDDDSDDGLVVRVEDEDGTVSNT